MNNALKTVIIEDALITLQSPYKLAYSVDKKTLVIDIGIHARLDNSPNALVYFPLKPKWEQPFENHAIPASETDIISDRVETALQQMGFNVKFCLPMGYTA